MRLRCSVALLTLCLGALLSGCATPPPGFDAAASPPLLLVGEQHDASRHPGWHREVVQSLAAQGRLAAVALEMAERGRSTQGLPATASEAQVKQALAWADEAWPWDRYGPAIMAAVRAGVPVLGANLPMAQMRPAMDDATLDTLLPGPALKAQQQAIRIGHCDMLPESRIRPMTRIQIARDRSMAQVMQAATVPGKTVVLIAGHGHVATDVGVPRHFAAGASHRSLVWPGEDTGVDHCAQFQEQMQRMRGASPAR